MCLEQESKQNSWHVEVNQSAHLPWPHLRSRNYAPVTCVYNSNLIVLAQKIPLPRCLERINIQFVKEQKTALIKLGPYPCGHSIADTRNTDNKKRHLA